MNTHYKQVSIGLWIRRKQFNRQRQVAVYLRIRIKGYTPAEIPSGIWVHPSQWCTKKKQVKGKGPDALAMNGILAHLKSQAIQAVMLSIGSESLSPQMIKERIIGNPQSSLTFHQVMDRYLEYLRGQSGKSIEESSFHILRNQIEKLKEVVRASDGVASISPKYARALLDRLQDKNGYMNSTLIGYRQMLKRIVTWAFNEEMIPQDLLKGFTYEVKKKTNEVLYLTRKQLYSLLEYTGPPDLMETAKLFVFAAYTGMSVSDLCSFQASQDVVKDEHGTPWISKKRKKRGIQFTVPLLPLAQEILNGFGGERLPIKNVSRYNTQLSRLSKQMRLEFQLSSHKARKSFAMMMLNEYGLPVESVAAMMGHLNSKVTLKHYSFVTQETIRRQLVA